MQVLQLSEFTECLASDWLAPPTNILSRYNLRRLLETCDLGLTTKEINVILCKVAEDPPASGTLSTDEAIVQTSSVVQILEPYILHENIRSKDEWKGFLRPLFAKRDKGPRYKLLIINLFT
jgi:hypothetical protein